MTTFGLAIKNFVGPTETPDVDALYAYAERAEALGFESLWAWDHVLLGVEPARGGHGAANLPAAAPADPHRRLRRRRAPARRHEGRRLADLFLHARELPEVVGEDRRVRARGRARPGGAHRHQSARDLRRALARGDRGADASLARDRVGRGRLERIDDRARRARQRRRVRRAAARPRPDGRRPDRPHPLSVRAGAGRAGRARHPAAPPLTAMTGGRRRWAGAVGGDGTRSRNVATDRDAPGWSPAAMGQRTRAAWSRRPPPHPPGAAAPLPSSCRR